MVQDPLFYLLSVPAVLILGISKGGFGGGLGSLAVPLMALVVSPVQAAAVLLPILCVMDLLGARAYRGIWMHRNVPETIFYRICYLCLFVVGLKLLYDGIVAMI